MRKFSSCAILAALILATSVQGQGQDDGSFYSRYGIGELTSFASSQAQALGGAGVGLFSYDYMNFSNPATWSRQTLVRVAAGAQFNRLHAQDAGGRAERLIHGNFNALQIGVPLLSTRLGLGASYEPYSRINYEVSTTETLDAGVEGELPYQIHHEGSGGLHQARIGLGMRLTRWASIGASADLIFGIAEDERRTTFDSADLLDTRLVRSSRLSGLTSSAGIALSFSGEEYEISIAAGGTLPVTLKGTQVLTLGESLDLDTLGATVRGNVRVPIRTRGGLSLRFQNRWLLSAEVRHEPWSSASNTLYFTGFKPSNLRDRTRYGGGVEFIPAGAAMQASYLRRIAYRIGFYRDNLYISPVRGTDIAVKAVTGGIGLPTLFFGTRVDITFEVGTRGSTNQNLIRDRFIGVSATLNVGERWFVKRRLG